VRLSAALSTGLLHLDSVNECTMWLQNSTAMPAHCSQREI
jgi:hypothetical protein